MAEWKDATGYSQGQRGKKEPTAWETAIGDCRIWISCGHRHYPGEWVMNAREVGIEEKRLGDDTLDLETVKGMALRIARRKARSISEQMAGLANRIEAEEPKQ